MKSITFLWRFFRNSYERYVYVLENRKNVILILQSDENVSMCDKMCLFMTVLVLKCFVV